MNRRSGVTLLETMAAIFIVGIGLISLLTLFPAGAVKMDQAIKDDRTGHMKENAASIADALKLRGEGVNIPSTTVYDDFTTLDLIVQKMQGLGTGLPPLVNQAARTYATGPSYAVLVDPNGYYANFPAAAGAANWQDWVAGVPDVLPRVVPRCLHWNPNLNPDPVFRAVPTTGDLPYLKRQVLLSTVFTDDMRFQRENDNDAGGGPVYTGWPCAVPGAAVDRTPRWSCAWLVRRPQVSQFQVVELTVVVYRGRSITTPRSGEQLFAVDPTSSQISRGLVTITWPAGGREPELKTGGWILDVSVAPTPRAKFFRVTNITQTSANSMTLEVQGTMRSMPDKVFVLENVVEVFERGTF